MQKKEHGESHGQLGLKLCHPVTHIYTHAHTQSCEFMQNARDMAIFFYSLAAVC